MIGVMTIAATMIGGMMIAVMTIVGTTTAAMMIAATMIAATEGSSPQLASIPVFALGPLSLYKHAQHHARTCTIESNKMKYLYASD